MKNSLKQQAQLLLTRDGLFTAAQHLVPQQKISEVAGRLAASKTRLSKRLLSKPLQKPMALP